VTASWSYRDGTHGSSGNASSKMQEDHDTLESFACETIQNAIDQVSDKNKPVKLTYEFFVLSNSQKKDLLKVIGWKDHYKHWKNSLSSGGNEVRITSMKKSSARFNDKKVVFCKIIEENTIGLVGAETDNDENYYKLIRQDYEAASGTTSGGGHGWGKEVYFGYSLIQCAFFSSVFEHNNKYKSIFAGRSRIPIRKYRGQLYNTGAWFGNRLDSDSSDSSWKRIEGRDARQIAKAFDIQRGQKQTGSTILIPGFYIDEEDDPVKLATNFSSEVQKWYWPAIIRNKVEVKVKYDDGQGSSEITHIDPSQGDYRYFCENLTKENPTDTKVSAENQFVRKVFKGNKSVQLPPVIQDETGPRREPSRHYKPDYVLSFVSKSKESESFDEANKVAFVRGHGKVVKYQDFSLTIEDTPLFGLLQVGEAANSESDKNKHAEVFFKMSEPHSHKNWVHTVREIKDGYQKKKRNSNNNGYIQAIFELNDYIKGGKWIKEIVDRKDPTGSEVSKELMNLFNYPGESSGSSKLVTMKVEPFSNNFNGVWLFRLEFEASQDTDDEWSAGLQCHVISNEGRIKNALLELKLEKLFIEEKLVDWKLTNNDTKLSFKVKPNNPGVKLIEATVRADRTNVSSEKISMEPCKVASDL
jgi:hypothetical protein